MNINDLLNSEQLKIILERLNSLANDTLNISAELVRIQAIGDLIKYILLLLVAIYFFKLFKKLYDKDTWDKPYIQPRDFGALVSTVIVLITGAVSILNLVNVWLYVGIFDPKLALAHMIFEKVMQEVGK